MSYSFQLRNAPDMLWNPGTPTGRTYVGIAKVITADPRFPDLGTWLTECTPGGTPDDYFIDPQGLALFLRAVLDSSVVDNESHRALARGFLEYSLAMLLRAGGDVEPANSEQAELIEAARDLAQTMVR
jgi:Family of unknown function (DUF6086)